MRWIWTSALLLVSVPGVAAAQSQLTEGPGVASEQQEKTAREPHPWRARPFAIDALIGIASPVGLAGLAAEYAPIEALSLSAGAGSNWFGWQLAGMLRWRFNPERRTSWSLGVGYSQGAHHQQRGTQDGVFSLFTAPFASMGENNSQDRDWRVARWLNLELGVERREERGVDVRGFLGAAILLNPSDNVLAPPLDEYDRPIEVRGLMLYLGGAFGYAI